MKAHLVQYDIVWEDKGSNYAKVRSLVEGAEPGRGDLIVLPELFDVGFTLNIDVACDEDGSTLGFLRKLAEDTGCTVHGSRAMRSGSDRAVNCATIVAPDRGGLVCEYSKIHPFSFGREPESYDGGESIGSYEWNSMRVCPCVCYDLRFPELFRRGVREGAEVFVYGANWPDARQEHWRTLGVARAIENQAFVFAVNRCGSDPHLSYAGGSIALGPKGEVLGELGSEEAVLSVEVDPDRVSSWRDAFPCLRDIKITSI